MLPNDTVTGPALDKNGKEPAWPITGRLMDTRHA